MPTQASFLVAADALDLAAHDAAALLPPTDSLVTPTVLAGGLVTARVVVALDGCSAGLGSVAQACRGDASECRRRAALCAQYWDEVAVWETSIVAYQRAARDWQARYDARQASPAAPDPGPAPRAPNGPPFRPFPWVD